MCGIAGAISLSDKPINIDFVKGMCDIISHRGPDDSGYFLAGISGNEKKNMSFQSLTDSCFSGISPELPAIDSREGYEKLKNKNWRIFLGHRRLSIIDLTPSAHQPMSDDSQSIWVAHNGEIYNFKEIRQVLINKGYRFKSCSDTEVIIYAYKQWGEDFVKKFNGMFAFALWDDFKKVLYLARDRFGIKPLYYTILDNLIIFASEIKAILQYKDYKKDINLEALNEYFTFQNLFQYHTLFKNIYLLPAANIAKISLNSGFQRQCYWDYNFTDIDKGMTFKEAKETTLELFKRAVKRQLVSDVPVGSYLSGGMDSSSVTAVASRYIPRLSTFTAGFELSKVTGIEATFDERRSAELVANEFKTELYEQVINAGDIAHVMPKLIWHLEDLRVGMSYSNYYISRLASKFVKVCLSGAGGDELYGGYPWRYYRVIKSTGSEDYYKKYYDFWQRLVKEEDKKQLFQDGIYNKLRDHSTYEIFKRVFTFNENLKYSTPEDHIANSMYFEIKTFLHGLLIVSDKIAMANSLEERVPFLDNDLVDFAMKIPVKHKLKNIKRIKRIDENQIRRNMNYWRKHDDGKNVLREAMKEILPESIAKRKKQGFSSPDESWFRGENFEYVKEMLLSHGTKMDKYINKKYVEKIIKEHANGINRRLLIWSFLCFEQWCRAFEM